MHKVSLADHEREVADLQSVIDELREDLNAERQAHAEPAEWLDRMTGTRIVVHTNEGTSIEGSLLAPVPVDGVHLRAAKVLGADQREDRALVGDVWIPRERVAFVQSLT